ncbi:MAG: hypothetical protein A2638_01730 [Nitrospirae bacterium RIFCSPHIGHO2_01_FULL_66_17]|nr:MAG: hypothetical protein A2638_01730 [Nitrospirae bacterium RIFCSPHIGHO2_01_FULL_66_17]
MSKIEDIERAIEHLAPSELEAFRRWFRTFDADAWDRQIEEDARMGRLDALANTALKAFESGRRSEL